MKHEDADKLNKVISDWIDQGYDNIEIVGALEVMKHAYLKKVFDEVHK